MMRWYVAYTQPQRERQAFEHLKRQGFEAYLPCYRKLRRHARRRELVRAPLFPRYLFVAVDVAAQRWRAINGTRGVCHLVCDGIRPAPVPDGIIERLRVREDDEGCVSLASLALFDPGASVHVIGGVFAGHRGIYERMTDGERVVVLLDLLGRKVEVVVPFHAVEAA